VAADEHCYAWGRAYREGSLVCGRVQVRISRGRAPRRRQYVAARFVDLLHPALRAELTELAHGGGVAAWAAAERMEPIVVVIDDPSVGRERIVVRVEPPQVPRGYLRDVEFGLRELGR
jgi:hypothetical protein